MFKYLLVACFIGVAFADDDAHAHVAKDFRKNDGHGNFAYGYDLTNGIGADEAGDEHSVHGEYHFKSKEGIPVKISYTADEHGYHPHGDLLPTPPPTPEAILKALKYIEEHPHREEQQHHGHNDGHQTGHTTAHHSTRQDHSSGHQSGHHSTHQAQHSGHQSGHHSTHQAQHSGHHDGRQLGHHATHQAQHSGHQSGHHSTHQTQHSGHNDGHHTSTHHDNAHNHHH